MLSDFEELNQLVRSLPMIDPGPDFAAQMVGKVSEPAGIGEIEDRGRLSLFEKLSRIAEDFVDLVSSPPSRSTGTLDEFNGFPPLSMGHIYFKLMDLPVRGQSWA